MTLINSCTNQLANNQAIKEAVEAKQIIKIPQPQEYKEVAENKEKIENYVIKTDSQ